MDQVTKDYINRLKPSSLPDWKKLLQEGIEMGKSIKMGKSRFLEELGYKSYYEYKQACIRDGKIVWQILLGLSTLEEQLDAIKQIYNFSLRTGLDMYTVQPIPSHLVALPQEYREKAPAPTSYMMNELEDWAIHAEIAPIQIIFQDQHLSCPNSIETTVNALSVGSPRIGTFSQLIWGYPGFTNDLQRFCDMIKSIGIIASKRDDYVSIDTYMEDGMPGYFMDCASFIGYALLEHYICVTLCGCRLTLSYGGLLSEGHTRMAVGMAIDKLLSTQEQSILSYINGSTVMQWDHDLDANYGTSVQEMLLEILVERKYKMGMAINPVSITEKVRVPTLEELLNIFAAGKRAEEKASEWDDLMDFTPLEIMRDDMIEIGEQFFQNVIEGLEEAGIDTSNPLELLLVLKKFNPMKFEQTFHPSTKKNGYFSPYYPTVLGRETLSQEENVIKDLVTKGYQDSLKSKKIIAASADGHTYGLLFVEGVLTNLGADVINGGVDIDPIIALDLADEEGTNLICISAHNGQALDYGRQLVQLSKERQKEYKFFIGGKLNGLLPGMTEPVDISHLLREIGVNATNDMEEIVKKLSDD